MKREKKLTPQQVKKIVDEVNAWNRELLGDTPPILWITHLWELSGELYLVRYGDYSANVFKREKESKKLRGVLRISYFAPHWTNNPKHGQPTELEEEREQEDS